MNETKKLYSTSPVQFYERNSLTNERHKKTNCNKSNSIYIRTIKINDIKKINPLQFIKEIPLKMVGH